MKKIILLIVMVLTYTVVNANDNKHKTKKVSYIIKKMKKNFKSSMTNKRYSKKFRNCIVIN
jgi:uncharacterized membrane-anchored protein YitT (DUF2179 family)